MVGVGGSFLAQRMWLIEGNKMVLDGVLGKISASLSELEAWESMWPDMLSILRESKGSAIIMCVFPTFALTPISCLRQASYSILSLQHHSLVQIQELAI